LKIGVTVGKTVMHVSSKQSALNTNVIGLGGSAWKLISPFPKLPCAQLAEVKNWWGSDERREGGDGSV